MTLHVHHLTGCAPTPLARYLKALGVLRVVGQQKDHKARGWWEDEHFCLMSELNQADLEHFFIREYAPTPVFNPWGARSGFYPGSSEKTARVALEKIESSTLSRLDSMRDAIRSVRLVIERAGGEKPGDDEAKAALTRNLRGRIRGGGEDWLQAVRVPVGEDYRAPALLGSGGNEGSGSYTSNYLSAVVDCIIDHSSDHALGLFASSSRTGVAASLGYAWRGSFGQFLPGGEGSAWDFLLAIEGTTLFRSSVVVRSGTSAGSQRFLASPFYFAPHAVGAGSSSAIDEFSVSKGRRGDGRGEQWFPLWRTPAGLAEIETMIAEGRCAVSRNRAGRPLEAARAISRLGVARGITAFCRYGYLQRNNLSLHLAVPLGRIVVRQRERARLVDNLASWLTGLQRQARKKTSTERLSQVERRLADAAFSALTHDEAPDRWQAVLISAVAVEAVQATGSGFEAGPIPPLSPDWLEATNDGTSEWRLARTLGGAAAGYYGGRVRDPVRHHWIPLAPGARHFQTKERRLLRIPRVVVTGRDAVADLAALVERRLIEAAQRGERILPLVAARGCGAHPADLAKLTAGNVDVTRTFALARAFMAIRWDRWRTPHHEPVPRGEWPDEAWMALRLSHLPWSLDDNQSISTDESIFRRLLAGDGAMAIELALRRLRAAGLRPPLQGAFADPATARLWAAALAFPIDRHCAHSMALYFAPAHQKEI